ncbi:hypothetical protein MMC07_007343 [Pseudocyphellaria aurata]|nr:hypothetical protein [Pseudocyphellaria aurata]
MKIASFPCNVSHGRHQTTAIWGQDKSGSKRCWSTDRCQGKEQDEARKAIRPSTNISEGLISCGGRRVTNQNGLDRSKRTTKIFRPILTFTTDASSQITHTQSFPTDGKWGLDALWESGGSEDSDIIHFNPRLEKPFGRPRGCTVLTDGYAAFDMIAVINVLESIGPAVVHQG